MKTNAYAYLAGYMHKEAGIASIGRKALRNYGGLAAKGGLAGGAILGGKHVLDKVKPALDKVTDKRKKRYDDALKDKPKETPAVQNSKKG